METYTSLPKEHFLQIRENIYYFREGPDINSIIDTPMYHYMKDLYSLLKGEIHVSQRIEFCDVYEHGIDRNPFAYHLTCVGVKATEQEQDWWRQVKEERLSVSNWSTLCFAFDAEDDYFFWKSYTSEDFGIRYKTSLRQLIDNIILPEKYEMYIGIMEYNCDCPSQNISKYAFYKFNAYKREKELRIYFLPKEKTSIPLKNIRIHTEKMIEDITLSPFLSKKQIKSIYDFIGKSYPDFKQKIKCSEIKIHSKTKLSIRNRLTSIKLKSLIKSILLCTLIGTIIYFAVTFERTDPASKIIYYANGNVDYSSVIEYFKQNKDDLYPIEGIYTVMKQYVGPSPEDPIFETHYVFRAPNKIDESYQFNYYMSVLVDSINFNYILVPTVCNYYNWPEIKNAYSISLSDQQKHILKKDNMEYVISPPEFSFTTGKTFSYIIWISNSLDNEMATPFKFSYFKEMY